VKIKNNMQFVAKIFMKEESKYFNLVSNSVNVDGK
jgi:hypothetical protein